MKDYIGVHLRVMWRRALGEALQGAQAVASGRTLAESAPRTSRIASKHSHVDQAGVGTSLVSGSLTASDPIPTVSISCCLESTAPRRLSSSGDTELPDEPRGFLYGSLRATSSSGWWQVTGYRDERTVASAEKMPSLRDSPIPKQPRSLMATDVVSSGPGRPYTATTGALSPAPSPSSPLSNYSGLMGQQACAVPALPFACRFLHGMVSVMTAAESARDLLFAVTQPSSYSELADLLSREYSAELFNALSGLVVCHVGELSGPQLSNLLWAYATVGHQDPGLVASVVRSLIEKVPELGPSELVNTLWALSRLGFYDPQLVAAVTERVWDALPAATPRQLAAFLQSYALLQLYDPQLAEDDDLLRSIAAKYRVLLPSASPTEIALVMSGMARLRRSDTALLVDASAALRNAAPPADLYVLAEAAWACALVQHHDLGLMELVADRITEALRQATAPQVTGTNSGASKREQKQLSGGMSTAWSTGRCDGRHLAGVRRSGLDDGVNFSALWPTRVGPGGRSRTSSVYDLFNPALPDAVMVPGRPLDEADARGLQDGELVAQLLWSFGVLHCYSSAVYTLLFRQLPRIQVDSISWTALARLTMARMKAFELQPGNSMQGLKELEAESANAWGRLLNGRAPVHRLPQALQSAAFVAHHAENRGSCGTGRNHLGRNALQAEVAAALKDLDVPLRGSSSIDGTYILEHTALLNGRSVCLEVLSADCCMRNPPHKPMGPAVARLRSLTFRGWTPLVIPFHEWEALAVDDSRSALVQQAGPDGEAKRAQAMQEAAAARKRYLRRKLEDLLGEELPALSHTAGTRRGP